MPRCEDLFITSSEAPNERIHVREKTADSPAADTPAKAVLFVHGATYPGVMFDVPTSSWLDHAVDDGYAAYALDVRGYGASTRSPVLDEPAQDNPPFARAESAVADIADTIAFIRERTGVEKIDLVGWSWGTMTTGMYAASQPGTINRLVLFAPVYSCERRDRIAALEDRDNPHRLRPLGAYRTETAAQARERWGAEITAADPDSWRDPAMVERWYDAMLRDEPADFVRAPNGVLVDLWEAFNGRARYEAGDIDVPTLVIRATEDATAIREDGLGLYDRLGSAYKQYDEIGRGTHFVLLERRAPQLFDRVSRFLASPLAH
ncbi:proline iminopeptidase protein [Salinisphaera shabanensis E1L3A]|jgi:pimeloyl-ACP methyl ester carboxylesterase|uniref:Proline iminopeptidase protein n=1 Tax=Salinisphaera shabanensis E1L3A TaxID=1033802 RepID=U2E9R7_9GAMM|nr:alpha/beta fold hydrolase [Salinisphaera shabanensis]ERJ20431.1 proline iminopeptidase protein [Salinisphaera shabanensis E1L3A]